MKTKFNLEMLMKIDTMKNNLLLFIAVLVIFFTGCSKDDINGLNLQAHDQNRMMDSMHVMFDRMMEMPKTNDPEIDFAKI